MCVTCSISNGTMYIYCSSVIIHWGDNPQGVTGKGKEWKTEFRNSGRQKLAIDIAFKLHGR